MSHGWRAIASMAAICALGMAACGAAIPTATPRASPGETSSPSAATSPDPTRTASSDTRSALAYPDDDLRSQIDIVTVDPPITDPLLAFVSDGQAIIFSSGRGPDSDADLAPDLWRYHPRAPDPESIYDLVRDEARLVATNSVASQESEHDVHLAGDLLVWRHLTAFGGNVRSELRYAFLPGVRDP